MICCYALLTPGFSNSWFTSQILFHLELEVASRPAVFLLFRHRSETWMVPCFITQQILNLKVILEQQGRVQRELSRCLSSDCLRSRISIYFWNSIIPAQVQHKKLSAVVQWHRSFPGSRRLEADEGAKPNWLRVVLNIRHTWIWSLQLHFITFIHINRPNSKRIQTWTFHLVSLCDENVSHFVSQTRNSLKDLYYISS